MSYTTFIYVFFIIIISVRSLFYCFMMTTLLKLVIISRLRLIIPCIIFSTIMIGSTWSFVILPITYCFCITKGLCFWKFYISENWWKVLLVSGLIPKFSTSSSSNVVFILVNIFGRLWCIFKYFLFFVLVWHPWTYLLNYW